MRTETVGASYVALPDGAGPHPGVVVMHEAFGLNDNIRDICRRFAEQGYAALGVDLFAGRNRAVCMARLFVGWLAGSRDDFAVTSLKGPLDSSAIGLRSTLAALARWGSAWAARSPSPGRAPTTD